MRLGSQKSEDSGPKCGGRVVFVGLKSQPSECVFSLLNYGDIIGGFEERFGGFHLSFIGRSLAARVNPMGPCWKWIDLDKLLLK